MVLSLQCLLPEEQKGCLNASNRSMLRFLSDLHGHFPLHLHYWGPMREGRTECPLSPWSPATSLEGQPSDGAVPTGKWVNAWLSGSSSDLSLDTLDTRLDRREDLIGGPKRNNSKVERDHALQEDPDRHPSFWVWLSAGTHLLLPPRDLI